MSDSGSGDDWNGGGCFRDLEVLEKLVALTNTDELPSAVTSSHVAAARTVASGFLNLHDGKDWVDDAEPRVATVTRGLVASLPASGVHDSCRLGAEAAASMLVAWVRIAEQPGYWAPDMLKQAAACGNQLLQRALPLSPATVEIHRTMMVAMGEVLEPTTSDFESWFIDEGGGAVEQGRILWQWLDGTAPSDDIGVPELIRHVLSRLGSLYPASSAVSHAVLALRTGLIEIASNTPPEGMEAGETAAEAMMRKVGTRKATTAARDNADAHGEDEEEDGDDEVAAPPPSCIDAAFVAEQLPLTTEAALVAVEEMDPGSSEEPKLVARAVAAVEKPLELWVRLLEFPGTAGGVPVPTFALLQRAHNAAEAVLQMPIPAAPGTSSDAASAAAASATTEPLGFSLRWANEDPASLKLPYPQAPLAMQVQLRCYSLLKVATTTAASSSEGSATAAKEVKDDSEGSTAPTLPPILGNFARYWMSWRFLTPGMMFEADEAAVAMLVHDAPGGSKAFADACAAFWPAAMPPLDEHMLWVCCGSPEALVERRATRGY